MKTLPSASAPPLAAARRQPPESPYPHGGDTRALAQATHRAPRVFVGVLVATALATAAWWLATNRPWVTPPAPLTASGTLEADEILVGSEVAGRIVALAREGQSVQAGEIVARLDDSMVQLQMRQVDAAAQQQLSIQADRFRIRAPTSGVVTRVPMHVGEVASPGQTVLAMADLSTLKFVAYVLEQHLGQVGLGQPAAVTVDPYPGRTFRGTVTSTSQRAEFTPRNVQTQRDRLNLVFGVTIRVENLDGSLKPGMPADAKFSTPQ